MHKQTGHGANQTNQRRHVTFLVTTGTGLRRHPQKRMSCTFTSDWLKTVGTFFSQSCCVGR